MPHKNIVKMISKNKVITICLAMSKVDPAGCGCKRPLRFCRRNNSETEGTCLFLVVLSLV